MGLLFLLASCKPYPKEVCDALDEAKDNRKELETVLEHYRGRDKQKYEAACFLIGNMLYHKSREEIALPAAYDSYFEYTDSLYKHFFGAMGVEQIKELQFRIPDSIRNYLAERYASLPSPQYSPGISDVEKVSATFLIDNIDLAFEMWRTSPLLRTMAFDEFKEVILPYRTSDECLLYKRSELKQRFYALLSQDGMSNIRKAIEWYKIYTLKQQRISYYTERNSNIGLYDLLLPSTEFNCHNQVSWTCNLFRACGMPVAYEFTSQWTNRGNKHFWCASPDSTGVYLPYSAPRNNLNEDWEEHLKFAGKVYRRTFEANKMSPYFLKAEDEVIPEVFELATLKDVTYRYHPTTSIELPLRGRMSSVLAYLSFVTRDGASPVAWGVIDKKRGVVSFEQVPLSMIFVLSYYEGDELKTVGEPFILQKNGGSVTMRTLEIDSVRREDMHLLRKYPPKLPLANLSKKLKGAYVLASNTTSGPSDTLCVLNSVPKPYLQEFDLNNRKAYRYYFFRARNKQPVNIAYIEFLGKKSSRHLYENPTPLPVFSASMIQKQETLYHIKGIPAATSLNAFDGDMETFVNDKSIEVDFKTPVRIEKVRLVPRNANNTIVRGDHYSLSYYREGEWMELGVQQAKYNYLTFRNIPINGLYLLQNLDNGKEELPFLYEDGKQKWIE